MQHRRPELTFIDPQTTAQRESALRILLENRSPEALAALESAWERASALLIAARRGEQIVGSVLAQEQPGKVALVWPPRIAPEEPEGTASELVHVLLDRLQAAGTRVVQAFPDVPGHADQQLLSTAGFEHVADLLYLV